MKNLLLRLLFLSFFITVFQTCNEPFDPSLEPMQWDQPPGLTIAIEKIQSVMEIQDKVTEAFFRNPEVVGTGTGVDEKGNPVIVVYTLSDVEQISDMPLENIGRGNKPTALPAFIENIKVVPKVTGMFKAYTDPTARFERPVPIGVSTGHPDITAGTIGCRVKDDAGNVYALSNNHVYANSNEASDGDNVLQPGPSDGGSDPEDAIGTLYDYEPISFSENNIMDAAIALCYSTTLDYSTVDDGYGTPSATTISSAEVGQIVQKYGRTTGLTQGEIAEINVTVDVCYQSRGPFKCVKLAHFVDQISITPGTFSDGGDSGSLIVTDDSNNPVGLLFAGSTERTIACPIDPILSRFEVTIDDGTGGTVNSPPTANFTYSVTELTVNFTDQSTDSDGSIISWSWNFGDGSTSTAQNPSHTYASDGTYKVTLTVTDDDGATDIASEYITVSGQTAGITITEIVPGSAQTGTSVDVTIYGSGFASGVTVALENGDGPAPAITITDVTTDGIQITATLTFKSGGPPKDRYWDVRVTNPDGSSAVLENGFTVTP